MSEFRAWVLPRVGAPLALEKMAVPRLAPDGVLVRVESAMVLSYMSKVLDGSVGYALPPLPFVPGTNAIGQVEATGPGVSHVKSGDRVFVRPGFTDRLP